MSDSLSGEITLCDDESSEFIKFAFFQDQLVVSGSIGDYSDNRLCFSFFADQTGVSLLSNVLKKLIDI